MQPYFPSEFLLSLWHAEGLRSSVFHNCEIARGEEYAGEMAAGCRENRIEQCDISDTGAGAMQLGITAFEDADGVFYFAPTEHPPPHFPRILR